MRDYEKLVKWLRSPVMWDDDEDCVVCEMLQDDAADAIDELLAKNKEILYRVEIAENMIAFYQEGKPLPNVPRWISVEERLPNYGEIILCYNRKTDQYELGSRHGDRTMYLFGYGMVGMGDRDFPTHWMLLPAPPKEDADAKT